MKYFDPSRPRICNRPAYVFQGRAIAPLPTLMIEPLEPDFKCTNGHDLCYLGADSNCPYCEKQQGFLVTIMIVREDRGGSWHHREVPSFLELQLLLSLWEFDPEAVLFDFGWEYRDSPERGSVREEAHYIRLEELEEEDEPYVGAKSLNLADLEDTGEDG